MSAAARGGGEGPGGAAPARTAFLFGGAPAEGRAFGVGPVAEEAAYGATRRAGEAALGEAMARDVAATLHACAAWDAARARGRVGAEDLLAAHSLGLYAALYAAGALDLGAALRLAAEAARAIAEEGARRPSGLVAVVGLPLERAEALALAHGCAVANRNAPTQAVLGGEPGALEACAGAARAAGALEARPIAVPLALHTRHAAPVAARLRALLEEGAVPLRAPRRPVRVGIEPAWVRTEEEARAALARNVDSPVDWTGAVRALREAGVARVVDLGPDDALWRLARWTDRGLESVALDGTRDAAAARRWLEGAERALPVGGAP
jgi:[acyl-carrier-protein] S-malonyltransferase